MPSGEKSSVTRAIGSGLPPRLGPAGHGVFARLPRRRCLPLRPPPEDTSARSEQLAFLHAILIDARGLGKSLRAEYSECPGALECARVKHDARNRASPGQESLEDAHFA